MLDWIDKYLFDYNNEKYAERFNKLQLGEFDTESDLVSGILSRMQVECDKHDWRFFILSALSYEVWGYGWHEKVLF